MRSLALLGTCLVLGGYLAAHGAQKLWGTFGGHGLEATAGGFDKLGLTPGKRMATLAGVSELGGGVLTATGAASPIGPVAIFGAMAVATAVHRKAGPFSAGGGYELPLTNAATAAVLAVTGPGKLSIPIRLPRRFTRLAVVTGLALSAFSLRKVLRAQPAIEEIPPEEAASAVPDEQIAADSPS